MMQFLRYEPDNILQVIDTTARPKVKSRSHYVVAHLLPPIDISPPNMNFLHLSVSHIQPGQDFPAHLPIMVENKYQFDVPMIVSTLGLSILTNIPCPQDVS